MSDIGKIAETLLRAGAPIIGGALQTAATAAGGPAAGAVAGMVIGALKDALGLPPDAPVAEVARKMEAEPEVASAVAQRVEAQQGPAVSELQARLTDIADARDMQTELVTAGSGIAWSPLVVSVGVLAGFIVMSFLAINATPNSAQREIILFLLGSWQALAGMAVTFWLGSSAGSKDKDAALSALMRSPPPPAVRRGK